ncbi:MAG: hypothetical protein ACMUIU_18465 [bacterium]
MNKEGGWDFTSIQEAIDVAQTGDVIKVSSGVYNENIIINKDIKNIKEDFLGFIVEYKDKEHLFIIKPKINAETAIKPFFIKNPLK